MPPAGHSVARTGCCATLAASSHNSQPWRFGFDLDRIWIRPDWARRCPIVDPDDHHLFTSLGCATENLLHAASVHGLRGDVEFDVANSAIGVRLSSAQVSASPLFRAIVDRQCSRTDYERRPVPSAQLRDLEDAARGSGVEVPVAWVRCEAPRATRQVRLRTSHANFSAPFRG
jgi:ribosomal protein S12 methylthiotransferase accessory factor YcaO